MTAEQAQLIFDSCLSLVIIAYVIGVGIGLVLKILKSAGQ